MLYGGDSFVCVYAGGVSPSFLRIFASSSRRCATTFAVISRSNRMYNRVVGGGGGGGGRIVWEPHTTGDDADFVLAYCERVRA